MKRKFRVRFEAEVEFTVDDALLKSCNTDEWRAQMHNFTRDEEFVEHIAFNTIINKTKLESIDGYADQPKGRIRFDRMPAWDISAREIKP